MLLFVSSIGDRLHEEEKVTMVLEEPQFFVIDACLGTDRRVDGAPQPP